MCIRDRIEHIVVITDDDLGGFREIERKLKGAHVVFARERLNGRPVERLQVQRLAQGFAPLIEIVLGKHALGGVATGARRKANRCV